MEPARSGRQTLRSPQQERDAAPPRSSLYPHRRCPGRAGVHQRIRDGHHRLRRASAGRALMVHDLLQAAMFEQHMLSRRAAHTSRRQTAPRRSAPGPSRRDFRRRYRRFLSRADCRSSGPSPRSVKRRSGVITTSLVVAARLDLDRSTIERQHQGHRAGRSSFPRSRCRPLVAHTCTVPPRLNVTSAVWSLAVTVVLPTSSACPLRYLECSRDRGILHRRPSR